MCDPTCSAAIWRCPPFIRGVIPMQLALTRWFAGTSRRIPVRRAERAAWAVTRLEDRTVPAAPAYAVGAGANHTPEVAVYDTTGALLVRFNAYDPLSLG